MKYVNPEMEIVEFDASILTLGLTSKGETDNTIVGDGTEITW